MSLAGGEGWEWEKQMEEGIPKDRVPGTSGMGRIGCGGLSAQRSGMRKY